MGRDVDPPVGKTPDAKADLQTRRDLGVAWMNRGHALIPKDDRPGHDAALDAALDAYQEAIARLRSLPVAENPSWANSLGAALMNHGHLLHRRHGIGQAPTALAAFDEAADLLGPLAGGAEPWPRRNLVGTLLNRANLLLDLGRFDEAVATARTALTRVTPHEREDTVEADLALKTRRALCDGLGQLLVTPGADQDALAAAGSDAVDEALALTRHWTSRGEVRFQPLALRFFRYGAQLYRHHQPHFLAEFIRENLPAATGEFHDIARETVEAALADRPRGREFLTIGDPASDRHLAVWRDLAALHELLSA